MRNEISLWLWKESTRNHHTATLHDLCIEVVRNPSWRKLEKQFGQKPWYVVLFGRRDHETRYAHERDAKACAEREGRKRILYASGLFGGTAGTRTSCTRCGADIAIDDERAR